MKCRIWLVALALASCSPHGVPIPTPGPVAADLRPAACRVGPDGGRPLADRGIGGTGRPATAPHLETSVETADRGIGGTGIIGVITGFASLCLAGQEVALPDGLPVRFDGHAGDVGGLRAGQVAAVATRHGDALRAENVEVMHEVIGPVAAASDAAMTVAGQSVDLSNTSGTAATAGPGMWVAVSGLRRPDGVIAATRVDPAARGKVLVRGELVQAFGASRIGTLPIRLPAGTTLPGGWSVVVSGDIVGSMLVADSARLDVAGESPSAYFGPGISSYVIEAYVVAAPGGYLVDHDFVAGTGLGLVGASGRRTIAFSRGADGSLRTVAQEPRPAPPPVSPAANDFLPAPLPGGSSPSGSQDDDSRPRGRAGGTAPPGTGQAGQPATTPVPHR